MCKYRVMRERQQADINAFPMFFAFNEGQFKEGMARLGLQPEDTGKIYSLGSVGGFIRKSDAAAFGEMMTKHQQELDDAIAADKTGNGFIFDMFDYELANHEYSYTGDTEDTLDALGLTPEDFDQNPALRHGLQKACKAQRE